MLGARLPDMSTDISYERSAREEREEAKLRFSGFHSFTVSVSNNLTPVQISF